MAEYLSPGVYVEEYDNYKDDNTLVDEDVIKERG